MQIDTIQAAVLLVKLEIFDWELRGNRMQKFIIVNSMKPFTPQFLKIQ